MFRTEDEARGYLAAMIDGEGSVSFRPIPRGHDRRVTIYNCDADIIAATKTALELLGIGFKEYTISAAARQGREPITHLVIMRKESLERLLAFVPLRSERKRETLKEAVESYVGRWP